MKKLDAEKLIVSPLKMNVGYLVKVTSTEVDNILNYDKYFVTVQELEYTSKLTDETIESDDDNIEYKDVIWSSTECSDDIIELLDKTLIEEISKYDKRTYFEEYLKKSNFDITYL